MKSIKQNYIKKFKPLELDFTDVKKIYNILLEISQDVEIKTTDTEFETIDELRDYSSDVIYDLEIKIYKPYISISFSKKSEASIYISEDTLISRGALEKIGSILNEKQNKFYIISTIISKILQLIFYTSLIILFGLFIFEKLNKIICLMFIIFTGLYSFLGLLYGFYSIYIEQRYNRINVHDKKESFLKRKKDEILVGIICAFASGIISFIIGFFIKK